MAGKEEKNVSSFTHTEIGTQDAGVLNESEPGSISISIRTAETTGRGLKRKLAARHVQVMSTFSPWPGLEC